MKAETTYTPITTNVQGVMALFGVGRNTAIQIGKKAGAVEKIQAYMEGLAGDGEG